VCFPWVGILSDTAGCVHRPQLLQALMPLLCLLGGNYLIKATKLRTLFRTLDIRNVRVPYLYTVQIKLKYATGTGTK
jgi:hypothetical protein